MEPIEYFLIFASVGVAFFLLKRKVNSFNRMSKLDYSTWCARFYQSANQKKRGMARAFIIQSMHLAFRLGAYSKDECREIERALRTEDPVRVVDEWESVALPMVKNVVGERNVEIADARLIGALMLVALSGVNPERDIERLVSRFN